MTETARVQPPAFERGDIVRHKSGEEWVLKRAGVDGAGGFVEPAGWPPCRARADDCELVESAADQRAAGKRVITDEYPETAA